MARPVDPIRKAELLDAAVDYIFTRGLTDLSFRPLADALNVSTTTLVHHFGTKEQMLTVVLNQMRTRILAATTQVDTAGGGGDLISAARQVWRGSTAPTREAMFRTFFAAYGLAVQSPERFADFLDHVVSDWQQFFRDHQGGGVEDPIRITLTIAVIRGLLLDLLATGDHDRVDEAFEAFIGNVNSTETTRDRT